MRLLGLKSWRICMNDIRPLRRRERKEKLIKLLGECNLMMRALKSEKFPIDKLQP